MDRQTLYQNKIPCDETGIEVKTGLCGLCGGTCPVDVYLKDGRVLKVEGSKSLPFSNGRLCVKGAALKQALYHTDRILYPMKRIGKRGEGKFERISWNEALDIIASALQKTKETYGPEAALIYGGHPKWFRPFLTDFANKYGTPNVGTESSTCAYALAVAAKSCVGTHAFLPFPDMARCRTLVVWGVNALYSNSVQGGGQFLRAKNRGVKIIVVDPKCTPTTEHADLHLRPKPGTDGALALAMAHVIIKENLYDKAYIDQYTYGFEAYKDYVMTFTPQKAELITGVPAVDIEKAARMMAIEKPAALQMSASPVVHNINGVQNARAIILLEVLTGNVGLPGGVWAPGSTRMRLNGAFGHTWHRRKHADRDLNQNGFPGWKSLMPYETQVAQIADYMEGKGPYPIKTLIAFGMNHRMWPRPDRIEKAFEHLDLFVNVDLYKNETCDYADLILPAAASLEREQVELLAGNVLFYQPQIVKPQGEIKNDMEILMALSKKLGFKLGDPGFETYEDYLESLIKDTGITLDMLKKAPNGLKPPKLAFVLSTEDILHTDLPSEKLEFVSMILDGCNAEGHHGLPIYKDFRDQLPMDKYPLILTTGTRKPQLFHSRTYRLPWISRLEMSPVVEMHPQDAGELDICDGDSVLLTTPVGTMTMTAVLDTSCLKGAVNVYHGAGNKDINLLLDDKYVDPISGFPGYKSYCCKIEKL